jgi:hypothetical protein
MGQVSYSRELRLDRVLRSSHQTWSSGIMLVVEGVVPPQRRTWGLGALTRKGGHVMDARTGADTFTTRTGAVALPLSIIVFVVSTAIHPSREAPMDNLAIFMEYAQSDGWIAIHFAQWLGVLLLFGGFLALYYSITTQQEAAAGVARFGFGAAVLAAASLTMLQAIDGVTLKWAVDAWVTAPADLKAAAFTAAEVARWTEYATQSYSNILLGLTLVLYGLAIALGTVYPRWLGWIAVGSGVAWIIHGLMVPYIGLFNSIPRLVALVLMAVWAFIIGYLMWRDGSRGRIRRTQSATPHARPR